MNSKAQIQSVALFFFYTLVDENLAKSATIQTIRKLKKKKLEENPSDAEFYIVAESQKVLEKISENSSPEGVGPGIFFDWLGKAPKDLGLWREFQRAGREEEILALTWSKILSFSDEQVARALKISEGTLRHRVSRSLQLLGGIGKK